MTNIWNILADETLTGSDLKPDFNTHLDNEGLRVATEHAATAWWRLGETMLSLCETRIAREVAQEFPDVALVVITVSGDVDGTFCIGDVQTFADENDSNPAYPNGRCGACGWGLASNGGCPNPECEVAGPKLGTDDQEKLTDMNASGKTRLRQHEDIIFEIVEEYLVDTARVHIAAGDEPYRLHIVGAARRWQ